MKPVAANIGDLVRYDSGPTALMRVVDIVNGRYYGRAFHSHGTFNSPHCCTNRAEVFEPFDEDRIRWRNAHDRETDAWIRGRY